VPYRPHPPDIGCRLQTDRGFSAECVRTGEVLLCPDTELIPVDWQRVATRMRSILVAPCVTSAGRSASLRCSVHANAFDHNDVAKCSFCRE